MKQSAALLRIWAVFIKQPTEEHYGLAIANGAGVSPGVLYPRLRQMVEAGYLTQRDDESTGRIYYRLTTEGFLEGHATLGPLQIVSVDQPAPPQLPSSASSAHND